MIRFSALGSPELRGNDTAGGLLQQPRPLALLAYLAVARPRGFHRRDSLVAMFWPELAHEAARNALRQVVHRLRRALGEDVLVNRGAEELGVDGTRLWCDVRAFDESLDAGRLVEGVELYRGDLLPGFFLSDAPDFERWLEDERARLKQRAAAAAWDLADAEAASGNSAIAAQVAQRAAQLSGDDEPAVRRHMHVLSRLGDRASAARVYENFATRLAREEGLEPSAETRAVVDALRRTPVNSPRISPPALPAVEWRADTTLRVSPAGVSVADAPAVTTPNAGRITRARTWILAAGTLAISVALFAFALRRSVARPAATPVNALAVFPFSVRGSDDLRYLREGMVDLLSAKMSGAPGLRTIDPSAIIAAQAMDSSVTDPAQALRAARRLGARWLIRGELVEIAGRLQMTAHLYEASSGGREIASASVSGENTTLFQLVDDLTGRLLTSLVEGRDTSVTRLSALTTHSLPALKAFLEGEQAMRAGEDARAVSAFRDAVTLDTTFVLAQYRLAVASTWASIPGVNAVEWATRAARNADRLTPALRDLLRAYDAYKRLDAGDAERLYRSITASHPDNVEAWMMLAEVLFHYNSFAGRSPLEGRAPFRRVLQLQPDNGHALVHLARIAALDGSVAELDSLVALYARTHRDAERLLEMKALHAYVHDDLAERADVARTARESGDLPVVSIILDGLSYAQNMAAASDLFATMMRPDRDLSVMRAPSMSISDVRLAHGQLVDSVMPGLISPLSQQWRLESLALMAAEPMFHRSRAQIEAIRARLLAIRDYPTLVAATSPKDPKLGATMRLYLVGLLSARLDDDASANQYIRELVAERDPYRGRIAGMLATGVRAELARSRGDPRRALTELDKFRAGVDYLSDLSHFGVHERFLRAELLHASGRDAEAFELYDSFMSAYDLPFVAAAHLRRAEIRERQGDLAAARFHYGRVLTLWKDAEPELQPLVSEAKRQLERFP